MAERRRVRSDAPQELRFGGGLNERDIFGVDVEEVVEGWNFLLDVRSRSLRPRAPQDLKGTAPNAGTITGIMQLIKRDNTNTQLVVSDDVIYDWDGASAWTDVTPPIFTSGTSGTRMRASYWPLDDILVMTDLDAENPLYKWNGSTVTRLKTGLTAGSPGAINALTGSGSTATAVETTHGYATGDLVTIAGANETEYNGEYQVTVQSADGFTYTTASGVTTDTASGSITSDKGTELFAKYSRTHNGRTWLFNIKADATETPHMILASKFEDTETFDNSLRASETSAGGISANDAFFLYTPDLRGINGVADLTITDGLTLVSTLVISTQDGRLFRLNGSDATDYEFIEFYAQSGIASEEAIVNSGNDVIYLRKGNIVEGLLSTQKFGDVEADDLSIWIPDTAASMTGPIMVYDQGKQCVYFFDSGVGGVLVFDKTAFLTSRRTNVFTGEVLSPWTLYKTNMSNNFVTKAATELRVPGSTTKARSVYWGDSAGRIFDINGSGTDGDGGSENINTVRKSRFVVEADTINELMIGRVEYKRDAAVDLELQFDWADEYHRETVTVPLKASFGLGAAQFWGGDLYWGKADATESNNFHWSAGRVVDDQISNIGFSAPGKGTGFILTAQISTASDFEIARLYL